MTVHVGVRPLRVTSSGRRPRAAYRPERRGRGSTVSLQDLLTAEHRFAAPDPPPAHTMPFPPAVPSGLRIATTVPRLPGSRGVQRSQDLRHCRAPYATSTLSSPAAGSRSTRLPARDTAPCCAMLPGSVGTLAKSEAEVQVSLREARAKSHGAVLLPEEYSSTRRGASERCIMYQYTIKNSRQCQHLRSPECLTW